MTIEGGSHASKPTWLWRRDPDFKIGRKSVERLARASVEGMVASLRTLRKRNRPRKPVTTNSVPTDMEVSNKAFPAPLASGVKSSSAQWSTVRTRLGAVQNCGRGSEFPNFAPHSVCLSQCRMEQEDAAPSNIKMSKIAFTTCKALGANPVEAVLEYLKKSRRASMPNYPSGASLDSKHSGSTAELRLKRSQRKLDIFIVSSNQIPTWLVDQSGCFFWRKTKGWDLCSPLSVIESKKRADAWERIWRSDDDNGLSKYTRWSDWLRENRGESISRLTDTSSRTHRTSERSSRRAPATMCPIQTSTRRVSLSHLAGGGRRGLIPTVRSSQGAGKGIQRGSERAQEAPDGTPVTENPGGTGLAEVEVEWLNQIRKQHISATDVGRFLEMWNIRETHSKGGP